MTRAFTRKSHPDMGKAASTTPTLPTGEPPSDLGSASLGALRDRLNRGVERVPTARRVCPKPPYLYAKIGALRHLTRPR